MKDKVTSQCEAVSVGTTDPRYRMSVRIAVVAATFSVVVCALLLYDYSRRQPKDPLEATVLKALKADLAQQPANAELKEHIRALDLQLRSEYFRQRAFAAVGASLLLGGVIIFLAAARAAATLRRKLPAPVPQIAPRDADTAIARLARWAVAAVLLVLIGAAIGLTFALQTELPLKEQELAASSAPQPANASSPLLTNLRSGEGDHAAKPAVPDAPPSDDEIAKMWPRFRGPDGSGISAYTNVPTKWNAKSGENILWKTAVPLPGNNSPVVWGDRIFLSGATDKRREVFCIDAQKGSLLWQKEVAGPPQSTAKPPKVEDSAGFAAPTTATDGRRVYAIFPTGDVAAFFFDGTPAWSRNFGVPVSTYGYTSSLSVYKNLLLVQYDQGTAKEKKSQFFALDVASGANVWAAGRDVANSWSTPIVVRHAKRDELITASEPWAIAYNPADGAELWRANWARTADIAPSPVFCDGIVYLACDNACLAAVRADGQGDVSKSHLLWKGEDGLPDVCSPLATPQYVFLLASGGPLTCYDAKKGDKLWEKDFGSATFSSSPSMVGNLLYLIADDGKAWVVEPGTADCKIVAESDLAEKCITCPAFQDGRMYLRGKDNLYCIGKN